MTSFESEKEVVRYLRHKKKDCQYDVFIELSEKSISYEYIFLEIGP